MAFDFLSWALWVCFTFLGLPKAESASSVFVINTREALLPPKSRSCGVKELHPGSREPLSATPGPSHGPLNAASRGHIHILCFGLKGACPVLPVAPKSYFHMSHVTQTLCMGYL